MATLALHNTLFSPHSAPLADEPVILVVDDDFGIRQFMKVLLNRVTAARVLDAGDPLTAIRIALTLDRPVDLLISDIDLRAGLDGVELASHLAKLTPEMKVVLMSVDHTRKSALRTGWRFLAKPFASTELLEYLGALRLLI